MPGTSTAVPSAGARAATYRRRPSSLGGPAGLTAHAELDALLRSTLRRIGHQCPRGAMPPAIMEAGRPDRRPLGTRVLAGAILGARDAGVPLSRLLAVGEALVAWTAGLDQPGASLASTLASETREQAEADIAQVQAAIHGDRARIEGAIEQTLEEIGAKRMLLRALLQAHQHQRGGR